jgi:hypothetical protein
MRYSVTVCSSFALYLVHFVPRGASCRARDNYAPHPSYARVVVVFRARRARHMAVSVEGAIEIPGTIYITQVVISLASSIVA